MPNGLQHTHYLEMPQRIKILKSDETGWGPKKLALIQESLIKEDQEITFG